MNPNAPSLQNEVDRLETGLARPEIVDLNA